MYFNVTRMYSEVLISLIMTGIFTRLDNTYCIQLVTIQYYYDYSNWYWYINE